MEVTSIPSTDPEEIRSDVQESAALRRDGVEREYGDETVRSREIIFRPGERTKLHSYDGVQILFVTEGSGLVGTKEEEREVSEGDLVLFSPGEPHWHGNSDDAESSFSHLYFIVQQTGAETTVEE